MKRQICLAGIILVLMAASAFAENGVSGTGSITIGGMTLRYEAPTQIKAYEKIKVNYNLIGQGDAVAQAIATNNPAYEKYFDSAIPHDISAKFDYLSEDNENATFRVTNTGDTIWKVFGYGQVSLLGAEDRRFLPHDIAPGESFERAIPIRLITPENGSPVRTVGLLIEHGDSYGSLHPAVTITTSFSTSEIGKSRTASRGYRTYPPHKALDEFGDSFVWKDNRGKPNGVLSVEVPPWADRLVISLIREGKRKSSVIPISPSADGLTIAKAPNKRWTLNGKPIMVGTVQGNEKTLPSAQRLYGGDNIVLTDGISNYPQQGPNMEFLKAAKANGFKVFPTSLCYVRLQWIGKWAGKELMPGRIHNENERVDALDPDFPKLYADYVDYVIKVAGEYLYRTSDGKIPIGLCDEAQYGYPWAYGYPTRWGGQTPQDVAAFRMWLTEKYGTIDKLNARWKTAYKNFSEIDPSPICEISPRDYPDPWKEWGPALDDFDHFRSKILNDMWRKTFAEIKKRHPEVLLGLNFYTDFASDTECIYSGFWKWGTGINWSARRTAVLPEDLDYLDFVLCWNTGSPEAARANINYWKKKGVDVIMFARHYANVKLNDTDEFYIPQIDTGGKGGIMIDTNTSVFQTMRATVEEGGIPAYFSDWTVGAFFSGPDEKEMVLFNKELAEMK